MLRLTRCQRVPILCAVLAASAVLANCGDSSAPNATFPNAAGVFHIVGGVDDDPAFEGSLGGAITFIQASLNTGTLGGSGTVTGSFRAGQVVTVTDDALGGSISPTGQISFSLVDANGTWSFSGTLSVSGNSLQDGRYTLRLPDSGQIFGDWSGSRTN